jgi:N-methylhydantoinase A
VSGTVNFSIGVDVGGTFTDVVVRGGGATWIAKAPTTPADQSEGVLDGIGRAATAVGLALPELLARTTRLVHGTTVATNALLEGKGARVAMLVTEGHRDVLDMREGLKPERYNLRMSPPAPLVPRALRLPVRERMRADGTPEHPLDPTSLHAALEACAAADVQAVAVCFLHAWRNSVHEQAAAAAARERLPGVFVTASSDVLPEIKEFERWNTAVANALVGPLVQAYFARLGDRLREVGLPVPPFIVLSHGGVATIAEAGRLAAGTALSGPAGGVAAAGALSRAGAGSALVTFDMGGTSTDIALVRDGHTAVAGSRIVGAARISLPSLDITTLGAGGGSIASVGAGGLLRVGPDSAGAKPGPACYGRGGTEATVTDANLVLGYLGERLGNGFHLDLAAAEAALARLGDRLGLDPVAAAAGVHRLVNARMADGIRLATVRRGVDPRRFALLAFGGAAGVHTAAVAAELGMAEVLVPVQASVLSAWGMLEADLAIHAARSLPGPVDPPALLAAFTVMEAEGRERLAWHDGAVTTHRSADMRYGEQVFEIAVDLDGVDLDGPSARDAVEARFHARHQALFGYALPGQDVATASARLLSLGRLPPLQPDAAGTASPGTPAGTRAAWLGNAWVEAPVWRLDGLAAGQPVSGPALLDSDTTTVLLRHGDTAALDRRGWLRVTVAR